jgi:hypothetical protein
MKINGSLVFDASSASEIQNLRVQKYASFSAFPGYGSSDAGRMVFATDTDILYYGSATLNSWQPLATGGNAFSLTEGRAIETSLGAGVTYATGVFNASAFTSFVSPDFATPSSFTDAINQVAAQVTGHDTLYELADVSLSAVLPTGPKFLFKPVTGNWVDHTLVLADVTDVTTTATELNQLHTSGAVLADFIKLHGLTASAADLSLLNGAAAGTGDYAGAAITSTNLSYLSGSTSNIQTQLDNKQPLDATLTALSGIDALTGILVETTTNTFVARTLVAPSQGITITNPAGIAGNPTFALANDLAALEGLTTTGYIVRTGDGTATTRSIAGTVGNIVVTNGSGVASDTSIDLAVVTDAGTGSFLKFTTDTFGRVTGTTPVVTTDITGLVDSTYVNVTGDTMTGSLVMATGTHITLTDTAVSATDAVNKAYVDALQNGLSWKQAVRAATTANITLSGTQSVDGVALVAGDRVLVKNQTTLAQNGIYVVAAGAWTRALDMDQPAEFAGSAVIIQEGTLQADYGYTQIKVVTTVGTSDVVWNQFSGSSVLTPGVGLYQSGNVLNVALGAGIAELPTQEVGIDLYNAAGGNLALILTTDGSTHSTATGAQLFLLLDAAGAMEQTSAGLRIGAGLVTNTMLTNSSVTLNSDTGTATLSLGGTLEVKGVSAQGISTSNTGTSITVTAADASSSQKGVAKFDSGDFAVTAGNVSIKAGGVDNTQLAFSYITMAGGTGSDLVNLGETFTFSDASSISIAGGDLVQTTIGANSVSFALRQATVSAPGVASFNSAQYSVTAGAVSLAMTLGQGGLTNVAAAVDAAATGDVMSYDGVLHAWTAVSRATLLSTQSISDLSDVTITSPAAQQALIYNGTQWVNQKVYHLETIAVAATTWTVTHNLGQQYCNVTVVDSTTGNVDNVIIPQSIVFTNTSTLTVTFNTAIAGKVVVMGIA